MLNISNVRNTLIKSPVGQRNFYQWLNLIFNKVDEDRRKNFGPDRTCAEWLLRNGGKVKWRGSAEFLADYNSLPVEGTKLYIEEVDASGSSINHGGFEHFRGCKHINRLILHDCGYIEDPAVGRIEPLNDSLRYLQISSCGNITSKGLKDAAVLTKLSTLVLFDFPYVKSKEDVLAYLKIKLPNCDVTYK